MSATMRAAVLERPGRAAVREVRVPEPGPGQVRVRLEGSGVCGSDLPVWRGLPGLEYPRPAGAPGHEGWGWVERAGAGVERPEEGDRVALLCPSAYAERCVVDADRAVTLPPELDDRPFPGEPLGCVLNVWRRCGVRAGEAVAVVGVGFLGALLVELAAGTGARVFALSRRSTALEAAAARGAAETVALGDDDAAVKRVEEATGGHLCRVVVEAAGAQRALSLAARLTGVRGRLVVAGYHQDGPREVNMQLWNWRGLDVINAHERDPAAYVRGMEEAVRATVEGRITPFPLLTHDVPLEGLGEALDLVGRRPPGFVKALVRP